MREARNLTEELVQGLVQQRDMYRALLNEYDELPRGSSKSSPLKKLAGPVSDDFFTLKANLNELQSKLDQKEGKTNTASLDLLMTSISLPLSMHELFTTWKI
jgi:hypothetical protein